MAQLPQEVIDYFNGYGNPRGYYDFGGLRYEPLYITSGAGGDAQSETTTLNGYNAYDPNAPKYGTRYQKYDANGNYAMDFVTSKPDFGDYFDALAPVAAFAAMAVGGGALAGAMGGAEAAGAAGAGLAGDATAAGYAGLDAASAASMGGGSSIAGGASLGGLEAAGAAGGAGFLGDATAAGYGGLDAAGASTMGGGASVAGGVPAATSSAGWSLSDLPKTVGSAVTSLGGSGSGLSNWAGPLASLASGALGYNASQNASDAQLQATREAAALNEPFRQAGMTGMNRLLDVLGLSGNTSAQGYGSAAKNFGMEDFQADPGYQFRQQQGEQAIQRAASAAGRSDSGRAYKDLMNFNSGLASQEYGNAYNRYQTNRQSILNPLQSLMGAGQTAANTIGDFTTQGGNAQAAGAVGGANAISNAITNGYGMYSQNQLLNLLQQNQQQRQQNGSSYGY